MSSDLYKVREMIASSEAYRLERQAIFSWAMAEEEKK